MKPITPDEIIATLAAKKPYFQRTYGVTRIGLFGSFLHNEQAPSSDIDIVIEMEKEKKTLHNFLQFKRALESEFERPVDLGFEHTLKPLVKESIKKSIKYV